MTTSNIVYTQEAPDPAHPQAKRMTARKVEDVFVGQTPLSDILESLHYLKWFKRNADFGPADSDVHILMEEDYERETGHKVPKNWKYT